MSLRFTTAVRKLEKKRNLEVPPETDLNALLPLFRAAFLGKDGMRPNQLTTQKVNGTTVRRPTYDGSKDDRPWPFTIEVDRVLLAGGGFIGAPPGYWYRAELHLPHQTRYAPIFWGFGLPILKEKAPRQPFRQWQWLCPKETHLSLFQRSAFFACSALVYCSGPSGTRGGWKAAWPTMIMRGPHAAQDGLFHETHDNYSAGVGAELKVDLEKGDIDIQEVHCRIRAATGQSV